jgi:hypothetical protein
MTWHLDELKLSYRQLYRERELAIFLFNIKDYYFNSFKIINYPTASKNKYNHPTALKPTP